MPRPALLVPRQRAEVLRHSAPQALTGGDPGVPEDDDEGITKYYRILGIADDAEYDDIMDAYMALSERCAQLHLQPRTCLSRKLHTHTHTHTHACTHAHACTRICVRMSIRS